MIRGRLVQRTERLVPDQEVMGSNPMPPVRFSNGVDTGDGVGSFISDALPAHLSSFGVRTGVGVIGDSLGAKMLVGDYNSYCVNCFGHLSVGAGS